MKKLLFITTFLTSVFAVNAQSDSAATADTAKKVEEFAEILPEYPGGLEKMNKFLAKKIKYPKEARKNNIEGRVLVEFVVETDGKLSNIKILKDIGYGCGEEVVRVIKKMPEWKPGSQKGKNVRVRMKLPVVFKIPKED